MRQPVRRALGAAGLVTCWFVVAAVCAAAFFFAGSREVTIASHAAEVRPVLGGEVLVRTGALLPDVRMETPGRIGVEIRLDSTQATSLAELFERYAFIASQPAGQIDLVRHAMGDLALDSALRGGALAVVPIVVWLLAGPSGRARVWRRARRPWGIAALAVIVLAGLVAWQPWAHGDRLDGEAAGDWVPLGEALGPQVPIPDDLAGVEIRGNAATEQTGRLVESAIDTYARSKEFYSGAVETARDLELRTPQRDELVVLLISDRHDNIGMDPVAKAIGEAGGAEAVFNAGDDTSTGEPWEAFSLDSVSAVFSDWPRYAVAGNHDHGGYVRETLADYGWTMLDGEVVDGPGGIRLLGVDDPRSSGLGNWREEAGRPYDAVRGELADTACDAEAEERVTTILVHDASLGREALRRGCADLVLGGHLHVRVGPDRVVGENGQVGYSFTTGTTGGAAYALAVGSKPRRPAEVSLITYRDGRPAGIQSVMVQTNGTMEVSEWVELDLTAVRPPLDGAESKTGRDRSPSLG